MHLHLRTALNLSHSQLIYSFRLGLAYTIFTEVGQNYSFRRAIQVTTLAFVLLLVISISFIIQTHSSQASERNTQRMGLGDETNQRIRTCRSIRAYCDIL